MSQKYYETKEFRDLQRKYYSVLKVGGFKDTETLRDIRTNNVQKQVLKVNFDHVRHFEKCSILLNSGEIKDGHDLFIFEIYCDGVSFKEISERFEIEFKLKSMTKQAIYKRVNRILSLAKIEPITFSF